jgi:hypothetical protein
MDGISTIAKCVVTLPCQSYKPIRPYCKDSGALSERFRNVFRVNPLLGQWLRRILRRSDSSGTLVAYWNDDPQSFIENGAAR